MRRYAARMETDSPPPYVPQIRLYQDWLQARRGLRFDGYDALWRWSVTELDAFWQSVWDYFDLQSPTPHDAVLARNVMPGARWFPGAQVNYARQVLRHVDAAHAAGQPALVARNERGQHRELSWPALRRQVAALALHLKAQGVGPGDRVAAYLPNIPETIVAFLACASYRRRVERVRARHGNERRAGPLPPDRAQGAVRRGWRELRRARPRPLRRAGRAARAAAHAAARGAGEQPRCHKDNS
ncbi:acetoacetyl-CoA synthase [Alicycliphilus sp. B1]|nr:acetoacetyl-CoA synthase [Alicycliphilus sp. B1]